MLVQAEFVSDRAFTQLEATQALNDMRRAILTPVTLSRATELAARVPPEPSVAAAIGGGDACLLYTSPSPRDAHES
eukprot:3053684-Prymnesium_polylepis.1